MMKKFANFKCNDFEENGRSVFSLHNGILCFLLASRSKRSKQVIGSNLEERMETTVLKQRSKVCIAAVRLTPFCAVSFLFSPLLTPPLPRQSSSPKPPSSWTVRLIFWGSVPVPRVLAYQKTFFYSQYDWKTGVRRQWK